MKKTSLISMFILVPLIAFMSAFSPLPQSPDPSPPDEVVKLIFIHHSTGENWLTDGYGDLGRTLGENNYFVSDTNYGWGPDAIGDRTDIPNWIEWFRGGSTAEYMEALFNENGQHSGYTRNLPDPGGENQIIMFKSCFPNSALEGSPDDPPGTYEELTVSGAKFVYNELLTYFAGRPDKLFVVITAPPLSDGSLARNARAFNLWLVNDWLRENNYTAGNVAVFDFYNVLTGKNAHHWFHNGQIEHITGNRDTLAYPSGDDHPSEAGSRKATEEFVPLLNIFYRQWKANAPMQTPVQSAAAGEEEAQTADAPAQAVQNQAGGGSAAGMLIDDFEAGSPAGTNGWEGFHDEATPSLMNCGPQSDQAMNGSASLMLDFDIAPNAWGTCALMFDSAQDWSGSEGISFYLHADPAGLVFDIDVYAGTPDNRESYLFTLEAPVESAEGWIPVTLAWSDFHRVSWEENAGEPFAKPAEILGLAFGASTYPDTPNTGTLYIDDLSLSGGGLPDTVPAGADPSGSQENTAQGNEESGRRRGLPCGGAFILPVFFSFLAMIFVRRWF